MSKHAVKAADTLLDVKFPVLDYGFVVLVDYLGSDAAVAEAARTSLAGEGTKVGTDDRALIRRLMRDGHTSPFEMVEMKFCAQMPIFVARQWIRHRTANINEMSGRYGELPELVYLPDHDRISWQSPTNKQGSGGAIPRDVAEEVRNLMSGDADAAFETYHDLLGKPSDDSPFDPDRQKLLAENGGVSRELARINLPLSTYTKWYWKIDLHNLLHFLGLRLHPHAQWEIRQYAVVIARMVEALCPLVWEAFEDFKLHRVELSGPEVDALRYLAARARGTELPDAKDLGLVRRKDKAIFCDKLRELGLLELAEAGAVHIPDDEAGS